MMMLFSITQVPYSELHEEEIQVMVITNHTATVASIDKALSQLVQPRRSPTQSGDTPTNTNQPDPTTAPQQGSQGEADAGAAGAVQRDSGGVKVAAAASGSLGQLSESSGDDQDGNTGRPSAAHVVGVESAEKALDMMEAQRMLPDVVLLDFDMSAGSGWLQVCTL